MSRNRPKISNCFSLALLILFVPFHAKGAALTEILYDREGADSGYEWVEVYNDGSASIDLTEWKLRENNVNHGIKAIGSAVLPARGYAIIADNADKFRSEYPGFAGLIFDSAFSLNNTGEAISLLDGSLTSVDEVVYNSEWGANGDGNSLQKNGSGWFAGSPTPGFSSAEGDFAEHDVGNFKNTSLSDSGFPPDESLPLQNVSAIRADAGGNRTVPVQALMLYNGTAYKPSGLVHEYAEHVWNFGNGDIREGRETYYQYDFPGEYVVMFTVKSGSVTDTERIIVKAEPALVSIASVGPRHVEVVNNNSHELDLHMWHLLSRNGRYTFPEHTIILPSRKLSFPQSVTGLDTSDPRSVALLYPDNRTAAAYQPVAPVAFAPVARNTSAGAPVIENSVSDTTVIAGASGDVADESAVQVSALPASAGSAPAQAPDGMYKYFSALLGVMFLGVLALFFRRSGEVPAPAPPARADNAIASEKPLTANDIKIVD